MAEMLGHARITTTLDLYSNSNLTLTIQREATEAQDEVLRA